MKIEIQLQYQLRSNSLKIKSTYLVGDKQRNGTFQVRETVTRPFSERFTCTGLIIRRLETSSLHDLHMLAAYFCIILCLLFALTRGSLRRGWVSSFFFIFSVSRGPFPQIGEKN